MLPKYAGLQLNETVMSDFIMRSALEAEELPISVETAREACLQYMGHSAVGNEVLDVFEKEMRLDSALDGVPALDAVAALSETVDLYLRQIEEFGYRAEHLCGSNTKAAMEKAGISGNEIYVEALLGALMVSGRARMEKEHQNILEAAGITTADVYRIADCYEPCQKRPLHLA
jgi:hypothetical protein